MLPAPVDARRGAPYRATLRRRADGSCLAGELTPTPLRPVRRTRKTPAQADPELVVTIGRGWGDHKVFRHYRAALVGVHTKSPGEPSEITRFRKANAALETRLRTKLPDRMAELDFLYGRPATPQETP